MRKLFLLIIMAVTLNATTPTYENVTRLYVATFDRIPDVSGIKYWVNDSGLSLEGIARSFMLQPESKAKYYPNDSIYVPDFVDTVYVNLFDHLPDSAGKEYWTDEIMKNGFDFVAVFILAIINGAQGNDAAILDNKTNYAMDAIWDQLPDDTESETCNTFSNYDYWTSPGRVQWSCSYYLGSTYHLRIEAQYVDSVQQGKTIGYYENGDVHTIYNYWNNVRVGVQVVISEDGDRRCIEFNESGDVVRNWYDC